VWKSTLDGQTLTFRLAGINNQNFIMRDEQTGSWWQQISGEAILGPLAGKRLQQMSWDEVTFAVWRREHPGTLVLLPDATREESYAKENWEERIAKAPIVTPVDPADDLQPRDLVVGVVSGEAAKAFPWSALGPDRPIADRVGETPLLILMHTDGRSLRCFDRRLKPAAPGDDRNARGSGKPDELASDDPLELFLEAGTDPPILIDAGTGSRWDFAGLAVSGPLEGRRLERATCLKDFWFDWKLYHPGTDVFVDRP
jgi:hypothetical protein